MKAEDLDLAYTTFCKVMTDVGTERTEMFLARFALLAIVTLDDLERVRKLITEAADIDIPAVNKIGHDSKKHS